MNIVQNWVTPQLQLIIETLAEMQHKVKSVYARCKQRHLSLTSKMLITNLSIQITKSTLPAALLSLALNSAATSSSPAATYLQGRMEHMLCEKAARGLLEGFQDITANTWGRLQAVCQGLSNQHSIYLFGKARSRAQAVSNPDKMKLCASDAQINKV